MLPAVPTAFASFRQKLQWQALKYSSCQGSRCSPVPSLSTQPYTKLQNTANCQAQIAVLCQAAQNMNSLMPSPRRQPCATLSLQPCANFQVQPYAKLQHTAICHMLQSTFLCQASMFSCCQVPEHIHAMWTRPASNQASEHSSVPSFIAQSYAKLKSTDAVPSLSIVGCLLVQVLQQQCAGCWRLLLC